MENFSRQKSSENVKRRMLLSEKMLTYLRLNIYKIYFTFF